MSLGMFAYDAFMFYFEKFGLDDMRKEILEDVNGTVLELGPGTGINLKYYDMEKIKSLAYIDIKFKDGLEIKARKKYPNITMIEGDAQKLPFEDNIFDSIVFTLVFCSVKNQLEGLNEVKRVLKENGTIYFIEHVEPHDGILKYLFNKTNYQWKYITGGCNLNRNTEFVLKDAGFDIKIIDRKFRDIFIGGIGIAVN